MKELRKRYCELSLIRHPDKATGTDEAFQELLHAYGEIGKQIEKSKNTDAGDAEEDEARRKFKESNIERINKTSITIKIMTMHVQTWESIFTEKYGQPIDRSLVNATKQWVVPYRLNENAFGMIKVTIWNLINKEKSTMLIQGEHLKQYLNVSFLENVIPKLFTEVVSKLPNVINDERTKSKTATKAKAKRACKKCQSVFYTVSELNLHVLNVHESNFNCCKFCDIKFPTKKQLGEHVKREHVSSKMMMTTDCSHFCAYCPLKFITLSNLKTHVMISHSDRLISCDLCEVRVMDEQGIKEHLSKSHSKEKETDTEVCDKCSVKFTNAEELRSHIKSMHDATVTETCEKCDMTFNNRVHLAEHIKSSHAAPLPKVKTSVEVSSDEREKFEEIDGNTANTDDPRSQTLNDILETDEESEFNEPTLEENSENVEDLTPENSNEKLMNLVLEEILLNMPENTENKEEDESDISIETTSSDDDCINESLNESTHNLRVDNELMNHRLIELEEVLASEQTRATNLESDKLLLEETNVRGFEQYEALLQEYEKVKKEKNKQSKEYEKTVFVINEELQRSYSKVDQMYKENVKLAEEKKVLQELHIVNADIDKKLREAKDKVKTTNTVTETDEEELEEKDNDKELEGEEEIEGEEEDEETEMLNLFMNQKQKRSSRTSPASEANVPTAQFNCNRCNFIANTEVLLKEHEKKHWFKCTKCDEALKTKGLQKRHLREAHGQMYDQQCDIQCDLCDFKGKSKLQMEKHEKVRHEEQQQKEYITNKVGFECTKCDFRGKSKKQMEKHIAVRHIERPECHFWRKGFCKMDQQCNFAHSEYPPVCRYGSLCQFWPRCKFSHPEVKICKYQNKCNNFNCSYAHLNAQDLAFLGLGRNKNTRPQSQDPPVWRPW